MKVWDNLKKSLNQDKRKVKKLVEGRNFDMMIMSLILCDAVMMGLMTTTLFGAYDWILFILDRLCMAIFIAEMLMKVWAYGNSRITGRAISTAQPSSVNSCSNVNEEAPSVENST